MKTYGSFFCLIALLMNFGCGGALNTTNSVPVTNSGGSSATPNPQPSYSDQNWHFIAEPTSFPAPAIEASLLFSGSSVTGIAHVAFDTGGTCLVFEDVTPITGPIDANNQVLLSASFEAGYGPTLTISGTFSQDRASIISGTYQFSKSCADGYSGTISAVKVAAVEGRYAGTLSQGEATLSVTADLKQQKLALVNGYFPMSGSLTITGPVCAGTYALSGFAIGNYISFSSNSLSGFEGLSARVDAAAQQLTLSDYPYSEDCTAGYQGVLQRQ